MPTSTPARPARDVAATDLQTLTAEEFRILLLSAEEPVDLDTLAQRLGLPRSTVASHRAAVRAKLGIGAFEPLSGLLARVSDACSAAAPSPKVPADGRTQEQRPGDNRRSKHVLRIAIHNVEDLAGRFLAQAAALAAMLDSAPPDDRQTLQEEVQAMRSLGANLQAAASTARGRRSESAQRPAPQPA